MMAVLLCVSMILVPLVIGSGFLSILYNNNKRESTFPFADALLLGIIAVLGAAEAAHLCAVAAKLSFSVSVGIFSGLTIVLFLIALAIVLMRYFRAGSGVDFKRAKLRKLSERLFGRLSILSVVFGFLALSQAAYIVFGGSVYLRGDMTMETVESFLYTDGIYQVNPLTGTLYQGGIPLRLEILCLPALYSALCKLFGLNPRLVVWTLVPLMTLLFSYSAFSCLGRCLFPEDQKKREFFMIIVALLFWSGAYHYVMDGFGVLYGGFKGTVIRNVVLMPYLLSLCLRGRWIAVFLCIAVEACIVWTLYGAGVCLFTTVAMVFCGLAERRLDGAGRGEMEE